MLVDEEMMVTTDIFTPRNDASSKKVDTLPTPKSTKQPKLCTTHYGKKECTFKPHDSPKSQPKSNDHSRTSEEATMFDIFSLSAAFCSVVILPTFYIYFVSIRH